LNTTKKKKIRFKISPSLLEEVKRTLKPDEDINRRIEALVILGMKSEGVA
jgi:hypothetical protein